MTRMCLAIGMLALVSGCMSAQTESCDARQIGFTASVLGIDYRERLPSPLAEIFAQGEVERLATMARDPASLSATEKTLLRTEWRAAINRLFAGTLPESFDGGDTLSLDFLRTVSPTMLSRLKACGPGADARLAYLAGVSLRPTGGDVE